MAVEGGDEDGATIERMKWLTVGVRVGETRPEETRRKGRDIYGTMIGEQRESLYVNHVVKPQGCHCQRANNNCRTDAQQKGTGVGGRSDGE